MKNYIVKWEIDVTATCPREAAKEAMMIMQDKNSDALVFNVNRMNIRGEEANSIYVDLDDEPTAEELNDEQWYHYSGVDADETLTRR